MNSSDKIPNFVWSVNTFPWNRIAYLFLIFSARLLFVFWWWWWEGGGGEGSEQKLACEPSALVYSLSVKPVAFPIKYIKSENVQNSLDVVSWLQSILVVSPETASSANLNSEMMKMKDS